MITNKKFKILKMSVIVVMTNILMAIVTYQESVRKIMGE